MNEEIINFGNKKILKLNLEENESTSLYSNFKLILKLLKKFSPNILILSKDYDIIYNYKETNILNELANTNLFNPNEIFKKRNLPILKNTTFFKLVEKLKCKTPQEAINKIIIPSIQPSFISTYIIPNQDKPIKTYKANDVVIKITKDHYCIDTPELHLHVNEIKLLNKYLIKISNLDIEFSDLEKAKEKIKIFLTKEKLDNKYIDILLKYSIGYGFLENFFYDENIEDVYIDSGNNNIYVYHKEFEELYSNVIITDNAKESFATRLRLISGRPFDEGNPVIDTSINNIRVCAVREPLTFNGIGFAFRRHKTKPWTLNQLVANKTMTVEEAGLLSYLVHAQKSILITGHRGSGKTSLLNALIGEIPKNYRIIIIEDTPEISVKFLQKLGYKIQHLKTKSILSGNYELSSEDALRTALRLGESVLVIGEVRGKEAKFLFEAMRVGAAGNVVLGTIHGSNAYDTWDRVVNDLGVPSTSFKATDVVVSLAAIKQGETTFRKRKLIDITEVKKYWTNDPNKEDGFLSLTKNGKLINLKKSKLINNFQSLKYKIEIKDYIQRLYRKYKDEYILSPEFNDIANSLWLSLNYRYKPKDAIIKWRKELERKINNYFSH